jgi:hypothetical protein
METNKLIAEFMGIKPTMERPDVYSYVDTPFFMVREDNPEKVMEAIAKYAKYQTSWDWLIPVIKKIKGIVESHNMQLYVGMSQRLNPFEYSIESIYEGVVEFIKNYNYINNLK